MAAQPNVGENPNIGGRHHSGLKNEPLGDDRSREEKLEEIAVGVLPYGDQWEDY